MSKELQLRKKALSFLNLELNDEIALVELNKVPDEQSFKLQEEVFVRLVEKLEQPDKIVREVSKKYSVPLDVVHYLIKHNNDQLRSNVDFAVEFSKTLHLTNRMIASIHETIQSELEKGDLSDVDINSISEALRSWVELKESILTKGINTSVMLDKAKKELDQIQSTNQTSNPAEKELSEAELMQEIMKLKGKANAVD